MADLDQTLTREQLEEVAQLREESLRHLLAILRRQTRHLEDARRDLAAERERAAAEVAALVRRHDWQITAERRLRAWLAEVIQERDQALERVEDLLAERGALGQQVDELRAELLLEQDRAADQQARLLDQITRERGA